MNVTEFYYLIKKRDYKKINELRLSNELPKGYQNTIVDFTTSGIKQDYNLFYSLIKDGGLNPKNREEDGLSFIHRFAKRGASKMIRACLELGVNVDYRTEDGNTALFYVTDSLTADYLLSKGANINALNDNHQNVVAYKLMRQENDIVKYLILKGASNAVELIEDSRVGFKFISHINEEKIK